MHTTLFAAMHRPPARGAGHAVQLATLAKLSSVASYRSKWRHAWTTYVRPRAVYIYVLSVASCKHQLRRLQ